MTLRFSPEQRAALEAWENRELSPEEFEARVRTPMSDYEREDFEGHVAWFMRRYPTAGDRLAHQRQLYAQWQRNRVR